MKSKAVFMILIFLMTMAINSACSTNGGEIDLSPTRTVSAPSPLRLPSPTPTTKASPTAISSDEVPSISVSEVKDKLDRSENIIVVDVRSEAKFELGHLPNAKSMPLAELGTQYSELSRSREIIVYAECKWPGDTTGARAVQILLDKGFAEVREMSGGYNEWQKANYPIEQ